VDLATRPAVAGLREPDLAVAADAGGFLRAARRLLAGVALDAPSVDARRTANEADRARFEVERQVDAEPWDGPGVHPGRVVDTLGRLLPADAIVVTDAGNFGGWPARGLVFRRPGTFIGPTSGAMGFGLPAAIGAALARPGRRVVALAGDGGFAMSMAEIETAVRERARVTAVVFDNRRYGTIRAHQETRGRGQGFGTELGPVDFAAIARAMGAHGVRVSTDIDVEPALREAFAVHGPSVVHLDLDQRWLAVGRSLEA
jgi:acetolactate synthase-1/2/3 large subunit